ncbi:MAG: WD40/YVTN/BNR-like repeat-containing protein [Caldilineaceae bacterium]
MRMNAHRQWTVIALTIIIMMMMMMQGGCSSSAQVAETRAAALPAAADPTAAAGAPVSPLATGAHAPTQVGQSDDEASAPAGMTGQAAEESAAALPGITARVRVADAPERILDFRRDPSTSRLFITTSDQRLSILDGESLQVLAEFPFGGELSMDAVGRRIYAGPGNQFVPVDEPLSVHVIDMDTLQTVGELTGVTAVAVDRMHGRLFAGAPDNSGDDDRGSPSIVVYDIESLEPVGEIAQRGIPTYNPIRDELLITAYTVFAADPDTGEILADLLPELSEQPFPWCNGCDYATRAHVDEAQNALVIERAKNSTGGGPGFSPGDVYLDASTLAEIDEFDRRLPFQPTCSSVRIPIPPVSGKIIWQESFVRIVTYRNLELHEMDGTLDTWRDGLFAEYVNPDTGQAYTSQGYVVDLSTLTPTGRVPDFCLLDVDEAGAIYGRIDGDLLVLDSDGGSSVTAVPTEPEPLPAASIEQILVSPDYANDPTIFLLLQDQRLYRTTDGGDNWLRIQGGLPTEAGVQLAIAFSPNFGSDRTMFAGGFVGDHTGEGVLRSEDAGITWQPLWSGLDHLRIYDVRVSPDYAVDGEVQALAHYTRLTPWESGVSLHKSTDHGQTWTTIMTATDEAQLDTFLAANHDAVAEPIPMQIVDYGDSLEVLDADGQWQTADLEQKEGESIIAVVPSPNHKQDGVYYALGDFSLWRTGDNGNTWSRWRDPRLAGRTYDNALTALAVTPPLADGSYELVVGTNAGEFWILSPVAAQEPAATAQPAVTPAQEQADEPATATDTSEAASGLLGSEPPQGLFHPVGSLALVWEASPQTQSDLGWALTEFASLVPAAYQRFERGAMIWDGDRSEIIVLFDNGLWQRYEDTFEEGERESDPSLTPPGGGYQPIRGFGKLWRGDADVREGLGWAIEEEHGYGAYAQPFEHGWIWNTPSGSVVLVDEATDNKAEGRWR